MEDIDIEVCPERGRQSVEGAKANYRFSVIRCASTLREQQLHTDNQVRESKENTDIHLKTCSHIFHKV